MSNIQKQHKISPAIAWLTIQKFIIFYCPLDGEHTTYRLGDTFFEDEHRKWVALEQELQAQGYSLEEVQALRRHYKEEYSEVCAKEKVAFRELNTGKAILNSMIPDSISDGRKTEYNREIIRDRKEQPVR